MKKVLLALVLVFLAATAACSPRNTFSGKFFITFETYGGGRLPSVETNLLAAAPNVEKEGYLLDGWYRDKEGKQKVYFPFRPDKNLTLYAKYVDLTVGNVENEYEETEGGLSLVRYTGIADNWVVPERHEGKRVVSVDLTGVTDPFDIKAFSFYSLERIEGSFLFPGLEKINVLGDGGNFLSEDGVLYSSDGVSLICYPCHKGNNRYIVKKDTKIIEKNSFKNVEYLQEITLNDELTDIEERFDSAKNLTAFFAENNAVFSTDDGVLYKEKILWKYPNVRDEKRYEILPGTTEVKEEAFSSSDVEEIVINDELRYFGAQGRMDDLKKFSVKNSEAFSVVDDVLFDKSGTFIRYPSDKEGKVVTVPSGTVSFAPSCVVNAKEAEEIVFPKSVLSVSAYSFLENKISLYRFEEGSILTRFDASAVVDNDVDFSLEFSCGRPPLTDPDRFPDRLKKLVVPNNVVDLYRASYFPLYDRIEAGEVYLPEYDVTFLADVKSVVHCACVVAPPVSETGSTYSWYKDEELFESATFPVFIDGETTFYARMDPID